MASEGGIINIENFYGDNLTVSLILSYLFLCRLYDSSMVQVLVLFTTLDDHVFLVIKGLWFSFVQPKLFLWV